jgi:hypothetical protein
MEKSKIKTHGEHQYSIESFDKYNMRYKFEVVPKEGTQYSVDIYSTNLNKGEVEELLQTINANKVISIEVVHTATKAQDDASSAMIDEWINDKNK